MVQKGHATPSGNTGLPAGPYAGHKALRTCTSWYAYAATFGSSSIIDLGHKHVQSSMSLLCYILCSVFVLLTAGPCFVDRRAV